MNNRTATTHCYSWSNHGNLGDDWIGEVSNQYFRSVTNVREARSLNPFHGGRHRLRREDGRSAFGELVLWGGGWLAADRPGSRTLRAWSRHVTGQLERLIGVGLGIGPFLDISGQQHADMNKVFAAFDGRLGVRSYADQKHLPKGHSAMVGSDVAILDRRFFGEGHYRGSESDYAVFSFPAFSSHWTKTRPWMTEERYLTEVGTMAERVSRSRRIVFVEFDQVKGLTSDSAYWSHLPATLSRPKSIEQAALLFQNAHQVYAGRLHAAILGAVLGNPTLAMAYHHKFEVVSELGIPTLGLLGEPSLELTPQRADTAVLATVRERGLDVLSAVRPK